MMGTTQRRGLRLVATDGHSHWADPEIQDWPDCGYSLSIRCEFGGVKMTHFVARLPGGRLCWINTPWFFDSPADAEAARDELVAQTSGEGE